MSKPVAVLISDIHYNLQTLELADTALRQAITKANELHIPLIVAGDLHDTKANLRGECVNAMIETFKTAHIRPYINIGNHCKINEKSKEHSLNFLSPYATIIDEPSYSEELDIYIIPYFHDVEELRELLRDTPYGATIIMHQGLEGSDSGEYIQDHSALMYDDVKDFRVISGHYHRRQDIKTGRPRRGALGLFSYIGNPYSLNFGEADHPEKGFQILMDDGLLEFAPTNLRKHRIIEMSYNQLIESQSITGISEFDQILIKITGSHQELSRITKNSVAKHIQYNGNFRLDLIPTDNRVTNRPENLSQSGQLDNVIEQKHPESANRLKQLWRDLNETD